MMYPTLTGDLARLRSEDLRSEAARERLASRWIRRRRRERRLP